MKTTEKAQEALHQILQQFEAGTVPEALAHCVILPQDVPASQWSLGNRMLMFLAGTGDARGFRQWQQAGRKVKPGTKAFYILAPRYLKVAPEDPDEEEEEEPEEKHRLIGFRAVPVFRIEDTEGDALPTYDPPQPPPLQEVADTWGLQVRYLPFLGGPYGSYRPGKQEIVLATHEDQVFFHELAHAAHTRVSGPLQGGQRWDQEVVAELAAAVLMRLYGRRSNEGASYQYIRAYAEQAKKNVYQACLVVLREVGRVLEAILSTQETAPITEGSTLTTKVA